MAADLTAEILDRLAASDQPILTSDAFPTASFTTVKSALDRLGSREMLVYKTIDREEAILTEEAKGIAANGSHEARVFEAVRKAMDGLKLSELPVRGPQSTALDGAQLISSRAKSWFRTLSAKRVPKLARAKLLKKGGSRRMGTTY